MDSIERKNASDQGKIDIVSVYERYRCPAEIVVPYRIPEEELSVWKASTKTRYMGNLWNMDLPWLITMGVTIVAVVMAALVQMLLIHAAATSAALKTALITLGFFPVVFVFLLPVVYPALVLSNLYLGYRKDWPRRLLGPSHIGITDSGFKLHVRGAMFYNYPNLAIWPEIFECDFVLDRKYETVSLRFVYQSGFGRIAIMLPLTGFAEGGDLRMVLEHFAKHVPLEHQKDVFRKLSEDNFAALIAAFEAGKLAGIREGDQMLALPVVPTPWTPEAVSTAVEAFEQLFDKRS